MSSGTSPSSGFNISRKSIADKESPSLKPDYMQPSSNGTNNHVQAEQQPTDGLDVLEQREQYLAAALRRKDYMQAHRLQQEIEKLIQREIGAAVQQQEYELAEVVFISNCSL